MYAPPLLILAPPGAPAPLLAAMLGRHPQAQHLPELNLFMAPQLIGLMELAEISGGGLLHGLLRTHAQFFCGGQSDPGIETARRWLLRRSDWSGAELLEFLARELAPRLLVSADTGLGWRPDYLDRLLTEVPDIRILHLLSHPRPYCRTMAAELAGRLFVIPDFKDYAVTPPAIEPQLAWHRIHSNIESALAELPDSQFRQVRSEDWQADPEGVFAGLCNWLGLAFTPAACAAMLQPEAGPFSGYGPSLAPTGAELSFLDSPCFERRLRGRSSLSGPVEWRDGRIGFAAEVLDLAQHYGYA